MSSSPAAAPPTASAEGDDGPVVQYVVLRKDLRDGLGWPMVRRWGARQSSAALR